MATEKNIEELKTGSQKIQAAFKELQGLDKVKTKEDFWGLITKNWDAKKTEPISNPAFNKYFNYSKKPQYEKALNENTMQILLRTVDKILKKNRTEDSTENISYNDEQNSLVIDNHSESFPRPSYTEREKKLWRVDAHKNIVENLAGVYEGYQIDRKEEKLHKMYYFFDKTGNIKFKAMLEEKDFFIYGYIDTFLYWRDILKCVFLGSTNAQSWCTTIFKIPKGELPNPAYLVGIFAAAHSTVFHFGKEILFKIDQNFDDLESEKVDLGSEKCQEWLNKYPQIKEYLFEKNDYVQEWF